MKKLFLSLFLFAFVNGATAQTCVPDTNDFNLFSISQDDIPCIIKDQPYLYTSYFFVPDTFFGYQVFSAKITNVTGLPTGLSYICSPTNCTISALGHGAVCILGTAAAAPGLYNVTFSGFIQSLAGSFTLSQIENFGGPPTTYTFTVIDSTDECNATPSSLSDAIGISKDIYITPNPSHGAFRIKWETDNDSPVTIIVSDLSGRLQFQKVLPAGVNSFQMKEGDLPGKGFYLLSVKSGSATSLRKLQIN